MPALAFPAEAGTHLPTPMGWKAELTWVVLLRDVTKFKFGEVIAKI